MIADVIKIAKSMKRSVVHISPKYMLGTDDDYCVLSRIDIESDIPRPITFRITDSLLGQQSIDKYSSAHPEIFFSEYIQVDDEFYINGWYDVAYFNKIHDMWNTIGNIIYSRNPIYNISGLDKDNEFMNSVAKLKVSSGLQPYILSGEFLQTSFNKVHAINSTDKVDLNIYEADIHSLLYEYIINKKKYNVNEYILYRKMNNLY